MNIDYDQSLRGFVVSSLHSGLGPAGRSDSSPIMEKSPLHTLWGIESTKEEFYKYMAMIVSCLSIIKEKSWVLKIKNTRESLF